MFVKPSYKPRPPTVPILLTPEYMETQVVLQNLVATSNTPGISSPPETKKMKYD
jgi:hypothetical protein